MPNSKYIPAEPTKIRQYKLWNMYLDHTHNVVDTLNNLIHKNDEFLQIYKTDLKWFNNAILNEHTDIAEDGTILRYGKPIRYIDIMKYNL